MKRVVVSSNGLSRFGIRSPHHLNVRVGYRGGIRK